MMRNIPSEPDSHRGDLVLARPYAGVGMIPGGNDSVRAEEVNSYAFEGMDPFSRADWRAFLGRERWMVVVRE